MSANDWSYWTRGTYYQEIRTIRGRDNGEEVLAAANSAYCPGKFMTKRPTVSSGGLLRKRTFSLLKSKGRRSDTDGYIAPAESLQ